MADRWGGEEVSLEKLTGATITYVEGVALKDDDRLMRGWQDESTPILVFMYEPPHSPQVLRYPSEGQAIEAFTHFAKDAEAGLPLGRCYDCEQPIIGMGVMVWKGDGHGGVEQVPDRWRKGRQALRCMTCQDRMQHPERRSS